MDKDKKKKLFWLAVDIVRLLANFALLVWALKIIKEQNADED